MSRLLSLSYLKPWAMPLAYSSPVVGMSCLMAPLAIVQGIYAKHYGISLTTIAMVVLVARIFDAITDPTIGYWVDRYYQRTGSRKPFVVVGGLLTVVVGYLLYVPPEQVSTAYFAACLILFYMAHTLFDIPHITWGGELTYSDETSPGKNNKSGIVGKTIDKAIDKNKVYSLRVMSGYLGLILFYTIPQLPLFDTSDITPETLQVAAVVAGLLILVSLWVCVAATSRGSSPTTLSANLNGTSTSRYGRAKKTGSVVKRNEFRLLLRMMTGSAPFALFCAAVLFSGIASGMWYGLIFIYVDSYLGMGDQFAQMFMMAFMVGVICTPFWYLVARHIGKKNVWIIGTLLMMVCFVYTTKLHPGETQFYELVLLKSLQTFSLVGSGIATLALLSDIADYGTWKYRINRSASYFAIYTFMGKSNIAIAMAMGLAIAGGYGFDAAATTHSEDSVFGLTLAMTWLPFLFSVVSLIFFLRIPLNERHSHIVRRQLDCRAARAAVDIFENTPETSPSTTSKVTVTTAPEEALPR